MTTVPLRSTGFLSSAQRGPLTFPWGATVRVLARPAVARAFLRPAVLRHLEGGGCVLLESPDPGLWGVEHPRLRAPAADPDPSLDSVLRDLAPPERVTARTPDGRVELRLEIGATPLPSLPSGLNQ